MPSLVPTYPVTPRSTVRGMVSLGAYFANARITPQVRLQNGQVVGGCRGLAVKLVLPGHTDVGSDVFVDAIVQAGTETQAARIYILKIHFLACGECHAVAALPGPEVLSVKFKACLFVDIPDVAKACVEAVVGSVAVVLCLACKIRGWPVR